MNRFNIEINYVLLFNSLRTHYIGKSIQNTLNNIKRWLNCVYKCEYPHKFQDEDCTIFDKIKIYQPVGKWYVFLISSDREYKLLPFTDFTTNNNTVCYIFLI